MPRVAKIAVALALTWIAGCDSRDVYLGSDMHPHSAGSGGHGTGGTSGGGGSGGSSGSGGTHATDDAGNSNTGSGTGSGGSTVTPNADSGASADAAAPGGCPAGFDDCDGRSDNGCETNLDSDDNHCGDCDVSCPGFGVMSFGSTCTAGVCVLNCESPFTNCDGNPDNGCESFGACP